MRRTLLTFLLAATSAVAEEADCRGHPLLSPSTCCVDKPPAKFNVTWGLSIGGVTKPITVSVETKWAPLGSARFFNLAKYHYFDGMAPEGSGNANGFFRVVPGFVVQFGIAGLPAVSAPWQNLVIKDDKVILSNIRGTIAYADAGADTRTTQVYINFANNSRLDADGFTPFGVISEEDMKVVDTIYAGYEQLPDQDTIYSQGDAYLKKSFPKLDYILTTSVTV
jgi:peptidyl-prolyl cis-trans isomerase A (cyclophilin A)